MNDPMRDAGQFSEDSPGQEWSPYTSPPQGQSPQHGPPQHYGVPPYYGAPPYYGVPPYGVGYGRPVPTNSLAIVALIMVFVMPPLGIVFGIVARRQISRSGEQGWGLATAGLWVSVAICALGALVVLSWIIAFIHLVTTVSTGGMPA